MLKYSYSVDSIETHNTTEFKRLTGLLIVEIIISAQRRRWRHGDHSDGDNCLDINPGERTKFWHHPATCRAVSTCVENSTNFKIRWKSFGECPLYRCTILPVDVGNWCFIMAINDKFAHHFLCISFTFQVTKEISNVKS